MQIYVPCFFLVLTLESQPTKNISINSTSEIDIDSIWYIAEHFPICIYVLNVSRCYVCNVHIRIIAFVRFFNRKNRNPYKPRFSPIWFYTLSTNYEVSLFSSNRASKKNAHTHTHMYSKQNTRISTFFHVSIDLNTKLIVLIECESFGFDAILHFVCVHFLLNASQCSSYHTSK